MAREPRDRDAKLFAAKSDAELRALLRWSYKRIRTRRRQLAAGKASKGPLWTLEEDRLLGTKSDREIARLIGRSVTAVRHRREAKRIRMTKTWSAQDDKILGTRTDKEVAMLLGRSLTNVAWRRKRLGIPPKAPLRPWTPQEEIGQIIWADLLRRARHKRHIPPAPNPAPANLEEIVQVKFP